MYIDIEYYSKNKKTKHLISKDNIVVVEKDQDYIINELKKYSAKDKK